MGEGKDGVPFLYRVPGNSRVVSAAICEYFSGRTEILVKRGSLTDSQGGNVLRTWVFCISVGPELELQPLRTGG